MPQFHAAPPKVDREHGEHVQLRKARLLRKHAAFPGSVRAGPGLSTSDSPLIFDFEGVSG